MQRNRATLNVEPWLSSGSMAKPEAIAARLPSSSTGLRPKRSLSQADSEWRRP